MKHALEWWNSNYDNFDGSAKDTIGVIQQIQLDALREGMRRAATLCDSAYRHAGASASALTFRDSINTAAEQLTEKDL